MGIVNIRNTVRVHLFRERFEVLLAVVIPFLFMLESGYACAWILVDGHLAWDFPSLMAFARGFAIEAFVFVCFKLVRIFALKGSKWSVPLPFIIGIVGVIVSSGMNLGWMIQSPEMQSVMASIGSYMPGWMTAIFRLGLGLLFPVGVALFALFDVRHLVDEMIASASLDNRAMHIQRSEMHRSLYIKSLRHAKNEVKDQYDEIAVTDAQNMVNNVRRGDLTFGSNEAGYHASSVTKVPPVQPALLGQPRPLGLPGPQPLNGPYPQPVPMPMPGPMQAPSIPPLQPRP